MESIGEIARRYIEARFPRASQGERDKVIRDWETKESQATGIANDFEHRVGPLQGLHVLDAGSGNGGISIAFAKKGASVDGVDVEDELVSIAQAEASRAGSTARFSWYEGTVLPFPSGSFDAAVSVSVIEHVTDPIQYFSEILRVLKPGGALYLAFPNRLMPKETHTGLWGLSYMPTSLARLYTRVAGRNPIEDNNLHFYTYWAIRKFLQRSGKEGRRWHIREERGTSGGIKGVFKACLRTVGIPHRALLPHVMLIVEAR